MSQFPPCLEENAILESGDGRGEGWRLVNRAHNPAKCIRYSGFIVPILEREGRGSPGWMSLAAPEFVEAGPDGLTGPARLDLVHRVDCGISAAYSSGCSSKVFLQLVLQK